MATAIPDVPCTEVTFKDIDGDEFKFAVSGDKMCYWLNGSKRPEFAEIRWQPAMGVAGIALPDINKGFPIPPQETPAILGGLRHLANLAGGMSVIDIPESVDIPKGDRPGIDNKIADQMLNSRTSMG
eukprot:TRINITY_DN1963_c0_g1_i1.p1 TRINITY_DN1963_c0_g1~~TRINITY_DN1963_c0_g1_i1.p1  ORF type:complete len:144 (+),score=27.15 TRINITY_DN1963_c0_g1_i1:54-434(+)